jgi:hypothetical protein
VVAAVGNATSALRGAGARAEEGEEGEEGVVTCGLKAAPFVQPASVSRTTMSRIPDLTGTR